MTAHPRSAFAAPPRGGGASGPAEPDPRRQLDDSAASVVSVAPEVFLAMGREVLAQQAFSRLLGAELSALSPGKCELQLGLTDQLKQQHGFAHGGVISYLADNALTYAGGTALRLPVVTSEFKINYLRPALGERLIARAEAVHVGRAQAVCRCEVFAVTGTEEQLCALAQGTIARLSDGGPGSAQTAARAKDASAP